MRCPVCRAENNEGPQCRRCRADLALLFALERERGRALAGARRHLAEGRCERARAEASRADSLRSDADSLRVLAVAALLGRDFATAWRCYRLVRGAAEA
jgi:hypothetical protein